MPFSSKTELRDLWKLFALAVSYYLFIIVLYSIFNHRVEPQYYMYIFIDDYIPFVKEMLIPYLLWFLYISLPVIFFAIFSKEDFYRLHKFMFFSTIFSFATFYFFPNGHNLRPEIMNEDFFHTVINALYSFDQPTNSAPSIHVLNSLGIHFAVRKSKLLCYREPVQTISLVILILIILSTVMIKQHSALDVFASLILGAVGYFVFYRKV